MFEIYETEAQPEKTTGSNVWLYVLLASILLVVGIFFLDQHAELTRQREARNREVNAQAFLDRENAKETQEYLRESDCKEAAEKYGIESEVTKKKCPGTKLGKQLGF